MERREFHPIFYNAIWAYSMAAFTKRKDSNRQQKAQRIALCAGTAALEFNHAGNGIHTKCIPGSQPKQPDQCTGGIAAFQHTNGKQ